MYSQVFGRCILKSADFSSPVPDIVYFLAAIEWQQMVFLEKAGLCKNMEYGELRKIALVSGKVEFSLHLVTLRCREMIGGTYGLLVVSLLHEFP